MYLKTGVAGFEQGRVVLDEQLVYAFHAQLEGAAEQVFLNGSHQGEIAVFWREIVHLQIILSQGGQNTAQHQTGIEFVEYSLYFFQIPEVFSLHLTQAIPGKFPGRQVGFEVEFRQFRYTPGLVVAESGKYLHIDGGRLHGLFVNDAHFLFCTYTNDIRLKPVIPEHILKSLYVVEQTPYETLHFIGRCRR